MKLKNYQNYQKHLDHNIKSSEENIAGICEWIKSCFLQ